MTYCLEGDTVYRLKSFFLYYTWCCNLSCRHCWVFGNKNTECIGVERAIKACYEAVQLGAEFIKISGGEPLVFFEDVVTIANAVKSKFPKIHICLETNATLITSQNACSLAIFDSISISLDSSTPSKHNKLRGEDWAFDKAMNGINMLKLNNVRFSITTTIDSDTTFSDMDSIVELGIKVGAERIKFNPIMNIGRAHNLNKSFYSISPIQMLAVKNRYASKSEIDVCIMLPCAYNISFLDPQNSRLHTCDCLSLISLLPNGDVGLCGEAAFMEEFNFGSYKQDSLSTIWNDSDKLKLMRKQVPDELTGICAKCVLRGVCTGGCRVEAIASGGSLNSPSYICQYMFDHGLFHFNGKRE